MRTVSVAISLFALVPAACALAEEAAAEHPLEPALTTSPRATLTTFLETFREGYEVAAQRDMRRGMMSASQRQYYRNRITGCLDLSEVPPALQQMQTEEAATCLKEVLDRIELPPRSEWPDEAKVADEEIDRWTIPHTEITIA